MTGPPATDAHYLSWGRVSRPLHAVYRPSFEDEVGRLVESAVQEMGSVIAYGLGRSYGDVALNDGAGLIDMRALRRLRDFDAQSGILRAEAGASLSDIMQVTVPKGWFPATVPGTRFVTLGGAIANDVHGKNHHRAGTFGSSVRRMGLLRSDRGYLELSPQTNSDLFAATVGGLGLTGLILWAEIALRPIASTWLDVVTQPFASLDRYFELADDAVDKFEHTVSWIDCTNTRGRGAFFGANWCSDGRLTAHTDEGGVTVPFDAPGWALNPLSLRGFNFAYRKIKEFGKRRACAHYTSVFFPLDSIKQWNRLYGRKGFYQYQAVVPKSVRADAVRAMIREIAAARDGSFLSVLKSFGPVVSPGELSFPIEGETLALDFRQRGQPTYALFERLDAVVREAQGRLYPAKDGRMSRSMMDAGYPQFDRVLQLRDPGIMSDFLRRML